MPNMPTNWGGRGYDRPAHEEPHQYRWCLVVVAVAVVAALVLAWVVPIGAELPRFMPAKSWRV